MGITVSVDAGDDPDGDAVASVAYREAGGWSSADFRPGFPLTRVDETTFVGSLFWLTPGTNYSVRATLSDPDGGSLNGVTLEAFASTRPEISVPAASNSFYVVPSGSGTACTLPSPCSLDEGLSQAQPGDEVVLRGGVYYEGDISIPRSGAAGSPIVIRAHAGETAILDGADPASFSWSDYGGGTFYTTLNTTNPHLVTADGQRLFPYSDVSSVQSLNASGTPGFFASGSTLYAHLAGGANPNSAAMAISRYGNAFYVEQDYIYFLDLTFRHYGQGDYPKAIYFYNASDNLVQGCTFASNDLGIGIKYASHRNVIQENEFYDTIFDWPWDSVKAEGKLEDGGVIFYDPTTGRGNIIRRNAFHDDFDGLGVCPASTAGPTNESDIYENTIYNIGDDGIETDGQCSNVRIWYNNFHDVLMGISLAPVYNGPVYAIRNLIYRTGVGNNSYSGSPFKFNSGAGASGAMYLLHNTCDAVLAGNNGLYIKSPGSWDLIYARNNIWSGSGYSIENYNASQPIDLDYDALWNDGSGDLVRWDNSNYATLSAFNTATGQEGHGLAGVPGFVDAGNADYALDSSSSLIDAGLLIPGVNDDFSGSAPDVGAFEYADPEPTLVISPPARAIAPGAVTSYTVSLHPAAGALVPVSLTCVSPSPSLTVHLHPSQISTSLGFTHLSVTDTHASSLLPGLWYTIPITSTASGVTHRTSAGLLVGGARLYLPLVVRWWP
jgi:parallel beta-helix repeat protein